MRKIADIDKKTKGIKHLLFLNPTGDEFEQFEVLVELPWSLLEVGTQVASPVLSALLCIPIYFIFLLVELVQLLRNFLPVFDLPLIRHVLLNPFSHYGRKYF